MAVNQLGYLGISVSNMDAWEQFGTEVLGMEIMERASDGTVYLRMDDNHHRVALYPTGKDDLDHVGWQTANRKQFEATKASLREIGVEYQQASKDELANRHVVDMVKFDLSGIQGEVFYGPHVVFEKSFVSPTGMKGFKTGILGLGHVGLQCDDVHRAAQILEEGLGFLVSDNLPSALPGWGDRFFHCNPREHTAVVHSFSKTGPKRIGHFMVEVNEVNDVGFALQRVEEKGIKMTSKLQRHTNDHMMSFYMVTPSGFGLEYGWGGRLIDDSTWSVMKYNSASIWRSAPSPARPAEPQQAAPRA